MIYYIVERNDAGELAVFKGRDDVAIPYHGYETREAAQEQAANGDENWTPELWFEVQGPEDAEDVARQVPGLTASTTDEQIVDLAAAELAQATPGSGMHLDQGEMELFLERCRDRLAEQAREASRIDAPRTYRIRRYDADGCQGPNDGRVLATELTLVEATEQADQGHGSWLTADGGTGYHDSASPGSGGYIVEEED